MASRYDRRVTGIVEQDITMRCVDSLGRGHELDTVFSYRQSDPFAVTITFMTPEGELPWTFSRDLLTRGLTDPVGEGDVRVAPSIGEQGKAVVIIELSSPDGHLVTQARSQDIRHFVTQSTVVVPEGEESHYLRIDDMISQLLAV